MSLPKKVLQSILEAIKSNKYTSLIIQPYPVCYSSFYPMETVGYIIDWSETIPRGTIAARYAL